MSGRAGWLSAHRAKDRAGAGVDSVTTYSV